MQSVHALRSTLSAGVMLASAIVGFGAGTAQAATTFTGYTDGCFGVACLPPAAPGLQTVSLAGLTYFNSTFNVTDAGGFAAIGSPPTPPANVDNLGSFTLTGDPFSYTGSAFDLRVTFTAPPGTVPPGAVFTSTIIGTVISIDNGGLFINFDNTPQHFTFTGGFFDLSVNDVSVTAGNTVPITGTILVTTVPEPESYAMMLAGLGLMGFVARRRKQRAA